MARFVAIINAIIITLATYFVILAILHVLGEYYTLDNIDDTFLADIDNSNILHEYASDICIVKRKLSVPFLTKSGHKASHYDVLVRSNSKWYLLYSLENRRMNVAAIKNLVAIDKNTSFVCRDTKYHVTTPMRKVNSNTTIGDILELLRSGYAIEFHIFNNNCHHIVSDVVARVTNRGRNNAPFEINKSIHKPFWYLINLLVS